MMIEIGIAYI